MIDFHYNRVLLNKTKKQKAISGVNDTITEEQVEESAAKPSTNRVEKQGLLSMVEQSPLYVKNVNV
jgi:hypothetical protein